MTQRVGAIRRCPDCGGILQPIEPEHLTSAEVALADADAPRAPCQCLLCGYEERPVAAASVEPQ